MNGKSIISPVDLGEKSPFNKKLIWLLVIVAAMAVFASAMIGRSARTETEEQQKSEEDVPYTQGTARSIKDEFDNYKDERPKAPLEHKESAQPLERHKARGEPLPADGGPGPGEINRPKEDIVAQGAVSAISIVDQNETQGGQTKPVMVEKTAEQKIAELFPQLPERLTEQEAVNRAAILSAFMQGGAAALPGALDGSAPTAMASKTKRFLGEVSQETTAKVSRRNSAPGKWVVTAGMTIPGVTRRAQNSDLPCAVEATTSVDVYDSYTSSRILIPKGSAVTGACSNDIAYGQERILSAFTRLILPNGDWFDLSGGFGMDRTGASGLKGDVNNHFFQMFSSAFMIAYIADRVDNNRKSASTNVYMGNGAGAKSAAGQVAVDTSQFMLGRSKHIQPTIDVEAGTRIYIQVKHDLVFD
ncbi:TrbI/VirB10 family protein [Comamonas sp. w2-DMI]|uniref:TrbI/VirB10 family protein n=1 Tax=Comamonas sp. w2-DMI TaxID=3126391 RepID=UPI0032E4C7A0